MVHVEPEHRHLASDFNGGRLLADAGIASPPSTSVNSATSENGFWRCMVPPKMTPRVAFLSDCNGNATALIHASASLAVAHVLG